MAYALFIDQGLQIVCDAYVVNANMSTYLGLYTNSVTPAHGDVNGTYTECVLSGYARINIASLVWTPTTISGEGSNLSAAADFTFSAYGGGTTIYGFFLIDEDSGDIVAAGLLDTAYLVPSGGGTLQFTLEIAVFPNTGPFP